MYLIAEPLPNKVFQITTRHIKTLQCPRLSYVGGVPAQHSLCAGCPRGAVPTCGGCPGFAGSVPAAAALPPARGSPAQRQHGGTSSGAGDAPGHHLFHWHQCCWQCILNCRASWPETSRGQTGLCPSCSVPGQLAPRDTPWWRRLLAFPVLHHPS